MQNDSAHQIETIANGTPTFILINETCKYLQMQMHIQQVYQFKESDRDNNQCGVLLMAVVDICWCRNIKGCY